jgi:hypothetical protein
VYKQTYVATAAPAPTDDDNAIVAFRNGAPHEFTDAASSDIYIKAVKFDGSVRVDA